MAGHALSPPLSSLYSVQLYFYVPGHSLYLPQVDVLSRFPNKQSEGRKLEIEFLSNNAFCYYYCMFARSLARVTQPLKVNVRSESASR